MNMPISLTNKQIQQAYELSKRRFLILPGKQAFLLKQINSVNDISTIPILLPLLIGKNTCLAAVVADVLHRLLLQIPADKMDVLEQLVSQVNYNLHNWYLPDIRMIKELNLDKIVCDSLYALLSFHRNGYVREAVLEEMSLCNINVSIPVLLIRSNDWVENIQVLASQKLIAIINQEDISVFLPHLHLIDKLEKKGRYDHTDLVNIIESRLIKKCFEQLLESVTSSNHNTSRAAFRIVAQDISHLEQLTHAAGKSNDLIIKLTSIDIFNLNLSNDLSYQYLCNMLKDVSPIIRRKCIYLIINRFPDKANTILMDVLFDKSQSLRESARFYLQRGGSTQFDITYQKAIADGNKPLHLALTGLAETGKQSDFKCIEPYLHNQDISVRAACIYAIFKLMPENRQELILSCLPTNEPKIAKTIASGLSKRSQEFDLIAIEKAFCLPGNIDSVYRFYKMKLTSLLNDRWNLLVYILELLNSSLNPDMRSLLQAKLGSWIISNSPNKVFTRPNTDLITTIIKNLKLLIDTNPEDIVYINLKNNLLLFI